MHLKTRFGKFFILCLLWLMLSSRWDALHLGLGLAVVLVSIVLQEVPFPFPSYPLHNIRWVRFILFQFWFLLQVIKANIYVSWLSLHPRMRSMIEPRLLQFHSDDLGREGEELVLAHAITLTPGTLTVDVQGLEDNTARIYTIHALNQVAAAGVPEPIRGKVASLFRELDVQHNIDAQ